MFLNTWSVRVAVHSVSSRSHSVSDSSRLFGMRCNSLSVSVSKLLEYRRRSSSCTGPDICGCMGSAILPWVWTA